ncbi:MAG: hypothetical protein OEL53_05900 [Rhodospirillales bacterium]|nr:hypothetical protein [Rhodospirillales bacterium]
MGGFASSFETAASSGANSTFSGVPVGNSVGGDGGGFAPAPSTPTSFALPETGAGGTDWAGQAFAPSAMTQPLPEPGLPETSDWKPQPVPETPSPNLLEKFAPKPATGSGLPVETPLLAKSGESEALRKVNPILSKLAREHPENPVHLKGGLLGALPTQQQPVKPPSPFAHRNDELPKLPKINWGAYDKHRIDGQTRISHDDWARIIASTKDFSGIIPTLVHTVNNGGDGGKANVADVLWRVAQKNPDHARFFQRELTSALGGETIPIRQALMHGEVSPAQLVDPAKSPGLLGTAKPNRFADPDFEKSYWQSAEAYKAEFAQRQKAADLTSPDMRAYPQRETPLPGGQTAKPDTGSQVAAAPAAVLAAPYVIEGAAAASTAAAAYWAAHPELHPKEPNWFSKMLGKNETSIADPEAAKPKIETFPADAGKPSPLGGFPSEPQHLSGKEAFPAQESKKGDNVIHEQRPSKVDLPNEVDIRSIAGC